MTIFRDGIRQAAMFVCIGAIGGISYIIASTILTNLGATPWIASILCYSACVPLVYSAQRSLTFRSQLSHASTFPKYLATQMFGLSISGIIPYGLQNKHNIPPILSFFAVAVLISIVNFIILRYWAFKPSQTQHEPGNKN